MQDPSTSPSVEAERGSTYLQLARITSELGQTGDAILLSLRAHQVFEALSRDHPHVSAYRVGLARSHVSVGNDYFANKQAPEARKSFEKRRRSLGTARPREPVFLGIPVSANRDAQSPGETRRIVEQSAVEGDKLLELSKKLGEQLEAQAPSRPEYQNEKAETLMLLGFSRVTKNFDEARNMLESALKIREKLADEHFGEPQYQSNLVDTCVFIAVSYSNARVTERVDEVFNLVRPVSHALAREHPDVASLSRTTP